MNRVLLSLFISIPATYSVELRLRIHPGVAQVGNDSIYFCIHFELLRLKKMSNAFCSSSAYHTGTRHDESRSSLFLVGLCFRRCFTSNWRAECVFFVYYFRSGAEFSWLRLAQRLSCNFPSKRKLPAKTIEGTCCWHFTALRNQTTYWNEQFRIHFHQ